MFMTFRVKYKSITGQQAEHNQLLIAAAEHSILANTLEGAAREASAKGVGQASHSRCILLRMLHCHPLCRCCEHLVRPQRDFGERPAGELPKCDKSAQQLVLIRMLCVNGFQPLP